MQPWLHKVDFRAVKDVSNSHTRNPLDAARAARNVPLSCSASHTCTHRSPRPSKVFSRGPLLRLFKQRRLFIATAQSLNK